MSCRRPRGSHADAMDVSCPNPPEDVPPSVQAGQNIHVIAEVGDFNQTQELFHLTPVETRFR